MRRLLPLVFAVAFAAVACSSSEGPTLSDPADTTTTTTESSETTTTAVDAEGGPGEDETDSSTDAGTDETTTTVADGSDDTTTTVAETTTTVATTVTEPERLDPSDPNYPTIPPATTVTYPTP